MELVPDEELKKQGAKALRDYVIAQGIECNRVKIQEMANAIINYRKKNKGSHTLPFFFYF